MILTEELIFNLWVGKHKILRFVVLQVLLFYKNYQMSKTPSNEGSNNGMGDVKYQKALKEINKLISITKTMKKENEQLQDSYDKLRADYEALEEKYRNLEFELQQTQISTASAVQVPLQRRNTQGPRTQGQHFAERDTIDTLSEFIEGKKRIEHMEHKIHLQDEQLKILKKQLELKNSQFNEILKKYLEVNGELTKLKANSQIKNAESIQSQKRKLKRQLQHSQEMIRKITSELEQLKKQCVFNQKNSYSNVKSIEVGLVTSAHERKQDTLSDFYFQKLRKSEAENIRLRKQARERKQQFKEQIGKLKQQNDEKIDKLVYLTAFLEKQQTFIEKFVFGSKKANSP